MTPRDTLADFGLIQATVSELGSLASLKVTEGADHSFHVLARSGRTDPQAMAEMLDAFQAWVHVVIDVRDGVTEG